MELLLKRKPTDGTRTHGDLLIDDLWECYTLEDPVRLDGVKIPGDTAIPAGRYQVIVNHSPRFGRQLPLLLRVPHFAGVRIHSGNDVEDTEGCILVGRGREPTRITESRAALEDLMTEIEGALQAGEQVWITVEGVSNEADSERT